MICVLGDTHFTVRNGSKVFTNYFKRFYENTFFPFLKANDIKTVIQVGDLIDNRKNIHIQSFMESVEYFFSKFEEYDIQLISILGNHDIFYKDTLSVNSPKILLDGYKNITVLDRPQTIKLEDTEVLMLPWICQENYSETMEAINVSNANICFGHLELAGFSMYKGIVAEEGMDSSIFKKFEYVITGHYHTRSNNNNIYYTGTPYELTWSDFGDQKGFFTMNLKNRILNFIKTPNKMFHKVFYDDIDQTVIKGMMENGNLSEYEGTFVKLIVLNKENPYLFDLFLEELNKVNPVDITIIEETSEVLLEEIKGIDESQDTLTTLYQYIDSLKSKDIDGNRLKTVMSSLYHEAMSVQT